MKKVLSALLALIMVVSCMAGITFTTAAEETETLLYVTGTGTGGPSCSRDGAITYGQTFTVAKGKMVTTVKVTLSDPAVTHTFRLYRWDNNRTYEENKAVAPLVEKSFTVKSNAENVFDLTDSVNPGYTGSLYWEIERTDTGRGSSPYGSKGVMTENGDITNIASYVNGQKGTGFSGAAVAHNAKVIVVDAPATETTVDLYGGGDYSNMCWSSNGTTVSFGQILTVAEGKAATALQVMLGGTKGGSMKLSVYRYVSENILASIASTPLYTENFVAVIDSYMTFTFDEALTGPLYWEITAADGISGLAATPKGGNSALTETADGSVTGINHVQNRTIGAAFVDWSAAKSIRAKLVLDSEATATNTPAPLTEEVKLYNGNLAGNIAIGSNWTISSFAQKFTVPSNRKVAVWSQQLATANNGAGNLSFYKWNKDYATTVAAAPLYSVDITCPNNVYLSVKIPETVKMSGDLLWVVTPAASGNIMPYGATELGTGCTDFVNGTATTASGGSYGLSGWGAGANAFSAKIVLNEYHYAPTGEATVVPLFNTVGAGQYYTNSTTKDIVGQSLTVPAGKVLTGVNIRYMCTPNHGSEVATGTFALYQWAGSYDETVSRTPLYTQAVSHKNNDTNITYAIPNTLMVEGTVLWLLIPDENSPVSFAPWGAKDQIAGVTSYCNGVATSRNNYGEYIESTISVIDGGIYREVEETTTQLWTVNGGSQYNAKSKATIGQSIALPDGKALTSIFIPYMCTESYSGTATGTVAIYQWNTDYATTTAAAPLYTMAVSHTNNQQNITYAIPSDLLVTGEILWTLTPDESSATGFAPWGAKDQIDGVHSYCDGVKDKALNGWGEYIKSSITVKDVANVYINSIDKSVIYSGTMLYQEMYPVSQEAFAAKANAGANGAWGAWDGTFTQVGNVYYTNHTYENNVTVNGEAAELDGNSVTVEAAPYKGEAKFLYWSVNGQVATNAPVFKWYPQSATDSIVAVYEGEGEAVTAPIAPAVDVDRDATSLKVTVTPAHLGGFDITEYGYYISVGTPITADDAGVASAIKDAAREPSAAYQETTYDLRPATAAQTIYVVTYVTYMNGETAVTVYGTVVESLAV